MPAPPPNHAPSYIRGYSQRYSRSRCCRRPAPPGIPPSTGRRLPAHYVLG